jgi:D-alanyl-D-alanine carboxypeptidase
MYFARVLCASSVVVCAFVAPHVTFAVSQFPNTFITSKQQYEIDILAANRISQISEITSMADILIPVETPTETAVILERGTCPAPQIPDPLEDAISIQNINPDEGYDISYIPSDLVDISPHVPTKNKRVICLRKAAAVDLIAMKDAMKAEGLKLSANSGYRSYYDQYALHRAYAPTAKTVKYPRVAPAGHSEHQSGLAVDVASELAPGSFGSSRESAWIKEHGYKYGFVISYPEDHQEVTGYMHEPWHLRYVGKENALVLREAGYTLAFKKDYYMKPYLAVVLSNLKNRMARFDTMKLEIGG